MLLYSQSTILAKKQRTENGYELNRLNGACASACGPTADTQDVAHYILLAVWLFMYLFISFYDKIRKCFFLSFRPVVGRLPWWDEKKNAFMRNNNK